MPAIHHDSCHAPQSGAKIPSVAKKGQVSRQDWDDAIVRFQLFRRMEKADGLRRAKQLPMLLSAIAQEIYDIANEFERTGNLAADLAKFASREIADRIAFNGYAAQVRDRAAPLEFLGELPAHLEETPAGLRRRAHTLKDASERAQRLIGLYDECIEMLRGEKKGGRFPSVSMYWLILKTDEWGASVPDIAKELLKRGVLPESKSVDLNTQSQWETLLKKGRVRARKRPRDSAGQ